MQFRSRKSNNKKLRGHRIKYPAPRTPEEHSDVLKGKFVPKKRGGG
jgi:hypothetical protein